MRMVKLLMPLADSAVANSHGAGEDLGRCVPKIAAKVQVVPNPVVTPELAKQAAMPLEHPWFGDRTCL